jgi:hypothetical protein
MGTAWLDSTGVPLEVEFTMNPLPKHVKKMRTVLRYDDSGPLGWLMVGASTEGEGGILFIKKRFRMRIEASEHWRKTARP